MNDQLERDAAQSPTLYAHFAHTLLSHYRLLALAGFAAAVLGYGLSWVITPKFTSTTTFIPEQSTTPTGNSALMGLVSGAGIGAGGGNQSPEFYARLLKSRYVRTEVLRSEYAQGSLFELLGAEGRSDSLTIALKKLAKSSSVSVDRIPGIVRLDVETKDPELSYAVANRFIDVVNTYNSGIRRSAANDRSKFLEAQKQQAHEQLIESEETLREFMNANRIVESPELTFEKKRLDRRVTISQELYLALARQQQSARLDAVNDTPVISVVDPPSLPEHRSSPRRGFLAATAFILTQLLFFLGWLFRSALHSIQQSE